MEAGATDHGVSVLDPGDRYEPPDCVSTMVWGMDSAYAGLNALGAYGQTYRDPGGDERCLVSVLLSSRRCGHA
ncbi:sensor domain-containing protein [Mycolicibacterium sp. ELW1]|uniref:sensor domain-containing protein n=1 Tax=Mycobacteriaceae TaxID=1762 RepID=UPI0011ED2D47|nr:sensor domain-containing protein [Mycobacterium sp. ELW1]QEN16543.1 sensor domain-containing protein [Mycobacterium sp. ELW1]